MLTSKERSDLRSLAQPLEPMIFVGKNGVSDTLFADSDRALSSRDLVKGRVLETAPEDPHEAAAKIAEAIGAEVVHVVGRTFVLFRPVAEKKPAKKKPAAKAKIRAKVKPGTANRPGKSYEKANNKKDGKSGLVKHYDKANGNNSSGKTAPDKMKAYKAKAYIKKEIAHEVQPGNPHDDVKVRRSDARTPPPRVPHSDNYAEARKTDRSPARAKPQSNSSQRGGVQGQRYLDGGAKRSFGGGTKKPGGGKSISGGRGTAKRPSNSRPGGAGSRPRNKG